MHLLFLSIFKSKDGFTGNELWNISEKDWLNLSNRQFLLAFFTHKKHPRGVSIHEIKELFPLKPSLVHSSFANDCSDGFQQHYISLFCCAEMRWLFDEWWGPNDEEVHTMEMMVESASRAKIQLTRSKCESRRIWTMYLECRWNNHIFN